MKHLEHDQLWALASNEPLVDVDGAEAQGHLEACEKCRATWADIQVAQQALALLPPVPALPQAVANRVGEALNEAVDRRSAQRLTQWWRRLFEPRLVLGFATVAAVLFLVWSMGAFSPSQAPVAHQPEAAPAVATPAPVPPPPSTPGPVPAPVPKKLNAMVASTVKTSVGARASSRQLAKKAQQLEEGSVVATEAGGSVWLQLPDGTQAGLTGASEVTLATLEANTLALEVGSGSLAMVVPHRTDRVLTVQAGEVHVKDLGTRFLVSKSPSRVLVAVEEGSVEVTTPAGSQTLVAGHAVAWHDGQLDSLPWDATPAAPVRPKRAAASRPAPAVVESVDAGEAPVVAPVEPAVEAVVAEADAGVVAANEPEGSDASEWATLPEGDGPPPPPQVSNEMPPPPPASRRRESGFSLRNLEHRLQDFARQVQSPFLDSAREAQVKEITKRADGGDCQGALLVAQRWLESPVSPSAQEPRWRRSVLMQKMRCLNRLGRANEANATKALLEMLGP